MNLEKALTHSTTNSATRLAQPFAKTGFVLDALEQALHERVFDGDTRLIHHSDRGSQYVSIAYTQRLLDAGIEPSVGSVGDSYDNALAETINGLYKAEVILPLSFGTGKDHGSRAKRSNGQRFNGSTGSTQKASLSPSEIFHPRRLREIIITCSTKSPSQRNLNKMASDNPGAVHDRPSGLRRAHEKAARAKYVRVSR